jgi:hypothetical protein
MHFPRISPTAQAPRRQPPQASTAAGATDLSEDLMLKTADPTLVEKAEIFQTVLQEEAPKPYLGLPRIARALTDYGIALNEHINRAAAAGEGAELTFPAAIAHMQTLVQCVCQALDENPLNKYATLSVLFYKALRKQVPDLGIFSTIKQTPLLRTYLKASQPQA